MISTSFFDTCDVLNTSTDPVTLNVNIGNNQASSSLFSIEGKQSQTEPNTFTTNLGTCKDLHGKTLTLVTTIFDINENNDNIQMDILLAGGKKDVKAVLFNTNLETPRDVAIAMVQILFV
jgi:outer membrane receptor for monomeric catechols